MQAPPKFKRARRLISFGLKMLIVHAILVVLFLAMAFALMLAGSKPTDMRPLIMVAVVCVTGGLLLSIGILAIEDWLFGARTGKGEGTLPRPRLPELILLFAQLPDEQQKAELDELKRRVATHKAEH